MEKHKMTDLSPVARTLLLPLAFRAAESQRPDALLRDRGALELASQFEDLLEKGKIFDMDQVCTMLRARKFDQSAEAFLHRHPDGTVVEFGCGLDTRFDRIDNGKMRWIGIDLPDVIALRREWLPETPRTRLIDRSVLDFSWMDEVAPPVIFLAEGVFPYFQEEKVKKLVLKLSECFRRSELVFDVLSRFSIFIHRFNPAVRSAALQLRWGLDRSESMENWGPGLRLLEEWRYFDDKEPRLKKYNWMRFIPPLSNANRILRYRLGRV